MKDHDPWGTAAIVGLALISLPYYTVRYPIKTYKLLVHKIGWYE